ncbi:hypothetical protein ABFT23_01280 [Nocardioides sp. C4-1]|uniref:hypothetical protein n=1 Tax=Nocardioides sp. C4-1 TaxID=3151851 RepID=UPI0032631922
MSTVFGQQPKPRLLVVADQWEEPEFVQLLQSLAPTVRFVTQYELEHEVNQREWDAVTLWGCDSDLAPHLHVVQFGGTKTSRIEVSDGNWIGCSVDSREPSGSFSAPGGHPPGVAPLLEQLAAELRKAPTSAVAKLTYQFTQPPETPFLVNANGNMVAGLISRGGQGSSEWWWLPLEAPNPERWVAAALSWWRHTDPKQFEPEVTDWLADPQWQTGAERDASSARITLEAAYGEATRKFEADLSRVAADLVAASDSAKDGGRRLLTGQGNELKDEVRAALADLGFGVTDADEEHAKKGDLLEDLRVADPDDPGWLALAEVRGYGGGAKVSDLMRIDRFVLRYALAEGKPPSARWYVVNQLLNSDPGTRQAPLTSNPEEVAAFAESGGMVLDTRDLFRLREAVLRGDVDPGDARARLKQPGVFALD